MNRNLVAIACAWVLFCAPSAWASEKVDDNYVHTFTGFTFPPKVADFTRGKITPYNDARSDIEVDYDNNPFTVHASVYVYPASAPLQQHYEECKGGVLKVHPDAKLIEEKPLTLDKSGTKYNGFSALYSFRDKFINHTPQDLLSRVIVFRRGSDYYVLFRISYLASDKANAERQIDDFIKQLAWPAGGTDGSAIK